MTNSSAPVAYLWNFGDGTATSTNQFTEHAYATPGNYTWTVISALASATTTNSGNIFIENFVAPDAIAPGADLSISWPATLAATLLEGTDSLSPNARWVAVTNSVSRGQNRLMVTLPTATGNKFFRVRRPW